MTMPLGSQALAEIRERDEQAGIDPRAPSRVEQHGEPAAPPQGLVIEPPPWSEHYQPPPVPTAELVDELAPEDEERVPAKRKPGKSRTPNLDAWKAQQP